MRTRSPLGFLALATLLATASAHAQDVQDAAAAKRARLKDNAADFWIYDDFDMGFSAAVKTKRPLLISFRCVP